MPIKKFEEEEIALYTDHVKPVVDIPDQLSRDLEPQEIEAIQQKALEEYQASKIALNESIADVALYDENALKFAGEISKRVLTLMEIAVELGLVKADEIAANEEQLKKIGVLQGSIDARAPGFLEELKQQTIKTKIISETGSAVEKGNVSEAGFVGFSPQAIQHATEGNLRERMYIPYKATHGFTGKLLANPKNLTLINERLIARGETWQLNQEAVDELRAKTADKRGGLYAYGAYAKSRDGSRKEQTKEFREEYGLRNPTIREHTKSARAPLSKRELLGQTGDVSTQSDKHVQWLPGEAWSAINDDRAHRTVKAADETADLMLTGISGTTDSILTMGYMLGMFDAPGVGKERAMRDALVACMGWMVDARDHTAHEIQTAAKSFGLSYTAGPDSYKQIRPDDAEFLEKLKAAQEQRGFKMPDQYLSADHVRELIRIKSVAVKNDTDAKEVVIAMAGKGTAAEQDLSSLIDKPKEITAIVRALRQKNKDFLDQGESIITKPNLK